jgi:hypothetical protein
VQFYPVKILLFLAPVFISFQLFAQNGITALPAVQVSDFAPVSPMLNSETEAVLLMDSNSCELTADPQRGFFTRYHHFRRVLILKKTALDPGNSDLGTWSISYRTEYNGRKKLKSLTAATYNLENGKVVKTPVQDKDIFIEDPKVKDGETTLKFAFPNAKAGSIVEFDYTVDRISDQIGDWYFQTNYPVLKSIYNVKIPAIWNFVMTLQNKKYITSVKRDSVKENVYSWQFNYEDVIIHSITWTAENVPPMKLEPFTSTIDNYIGCVKFQLSVRPVRPGQSERIINTWEWVTDRLMSGDDFGVQIKDIHPWVRKLARGLVEDNDTDIQKARKIYAFVRDHFKVNGRSWGITDDQTLETIYKAGVGNVAEINLTLIAMLKTQKLNADPVILATRDNGLTNVTYPVMDNYNYTICRLETGGKVYYLDASDAGMGFGRLPANCYNGHARLIKKDGYAVYLEADSIRESSSTYSFIEYDSASDMLALYCTQKPGYYESTAIRAEIKEKKMDAYLKSITGTKTPKGKIDSFSFADLDNPDKSLTVFYRMNLDRGNDAHFYFNPFLNSGLKANPFKSAERGYPVELPYVSDDIFVLNMDIPDGYEVEEMPRSERFKLNEKEGSFEYLIQKSEHSVQLKSVIKINKAIFEPEDYNILKEFYAAIIRKQSEMIVFKKVGT